MVFFSFIPLQFPTLWHPNFLHLPLSPIYNDTQLLNKPSDVGEESFKSPNMTLAQPIIR